MKRREFLKASAAALMLGGCAKHTNLAGPDLMEPTEAQLKRKLTGRSTVGLIKCPSYDEDVFAAIKPYIKQLDLPDLKNKTVVIKPNMVEFHPGRPITTNPAVIFAAVQLADYLGAREITIGEGPGHMRDTEMLLENTGVAELCRKHKLRFVDLNLDDLERVPVDGGFAGFKELYLPRTIVEAGAVISVPKMKAHHWVGVTASMKNLFGTVPGRKYGWPKNILHYHGIPQCILDLQHIIKPSLGFVDGIVAMEGDGPINGTAKNSGFVVIGRDLAAVDSTCARTMCAPYEKLQYIHMAGKVVGNTDPRFIDLIGATIDDVKQKFGMPITFQDNPHLEKVLGQSG